MKKTIYFNNFIQFKIQQIYKLFKIVYIKKGVLKKSKMNIKKQILIIIIFSIIFYFIFEIHIFAADPKLVTTITSAFEKIESYILKISTPAAAVAVGSGVFMKKFSFGDEEKIRTANKLIRGSLFSYGFILCIDLILSLFQTLLS